MSTPKPGSDEAVRLGCVCPILDNGHGRGAYQVGGVWQHWINAECPLHGTRKQDADAGGAE